MVLLSLCILLSVSAATGQGSNQPDTNAGVVKALKLGNYGFCYTFVTNGSSIWVSENIYLDHPKLNGNRQVILSYVGSTESDGSGETGAIRFEQVNFAYLAPPVLLSGGGETYELASTLLFPADGVRSNGGPENPGCPVGRWLIPGVEVVKIENGNSSLVSFKNIYANIYLTYAIP